MKKYLSLIFLLSSLFIELQAIQLSTRAVLIGCEPGQTAELCQQLDQAKAFLPVQPGSFLKNKSLLIAWINPQAEQAPQNQPELRSLLQSLRQWPETRFAQAFLEDSEGRLAGMTDEILVKTRPGTEPATLLAFGQGIREITADPYQQNWFRLRLQKQAPSNPATLSNWLSRQSCILSAAPNLLYQLSVHTNDPYFIHQWSLDNTGIAIQGNGTPGADMSVTDAWTITTGSPDIKIAIIDSGVDTLHEDLEDNLVPGFDATGGGSLGYPNTAFPSDGHGTSCAGIVAAKGDNNLGIAGVCYDCSLVPVKLFSYIFNPFGDPLPFATGSDMADAITWAWKEGNADVISSSWGIEDNLIGLLPDGTAIVEDALDLALDSGRAGLGVPMFFSSGNEGNAPIWPGRRAGLFSVNASTMCDERKYPNSCDGLSWEGNWGDSLDVAAPGVRIATTDMTGADGFEGSDYTLSFGGTSAACPNAAGVMGLILSVEDQLSLTQAHELMETTCAKVGGYNYNQALVHGTWSDEMGYGRVDAFAAVQAAVLVGRAVARPSEKNNKTMIYPNPSNGKFKIAGQTEKTSWIRIELLNGFGQLMAVREYPVSPQQSYILELDFGAEPFPDGIYLLKINNGDSEDCFRHIIFRGL